MLGLMVVAALQPWAEISERLRPIVLYDAFACGIISGCFGGREIISRDFALPVSSSRGRSRPDRNRI